MVKRRILYGVLLAVTIYFSLLYTYDGVRFLIGLLLLIPLTGLVQAVWSGKRCRVFMSGESISVERGTKGTIEVCVENRGLLPIAAVQVLLEWDGPARCAERRKYWIREIDGRKTRKMTYTVNAKHCGRGILRISAVRVCDYLGLCSVTRKSQETLGLFITPAVRTLAIDGMDAAGLSDQPGADRDAAEGYEVRGYRPGDSLHRIHWKLTVRTDELQVRDYEGGGIDGITLFFNFQNPGDILADADRWDAYLERAVSLLFSLYRGEHKLCRAVWPEHGENEALEIGREEDIDACMYRLLALDTEDAAQLELPANALHLDMDLRLCLGEQCIYE